MLSNKDVKYYASLKLKKYREDENKFLIEGFHLIEEVLKSNYKVECVIASEKISKNIHGSLFKLEEKSIPFYSLKETQFIKLTETKNSQGIIAVVNKEPSVSVSVFFESKLVVALDKINDPGNMGTIIRTAYWFGADAVLAGNNSADIYNPKVLRSSQGAVFHINILENISLEKSLPALYDKEFEIYLLDVNGNLDFNDITPRRKTVFVFGSESDGISANILNQGYKRVKIKGYSGCESLNVAVSCGIVLYGYSRNINTNAS